MPDKPIADMLKEGAARLEEGQVRVIVLGSVATAYHKSLFAPIIREEQLRSVQAAIALSLVAMYPSLLLEDPNPLLGAIEMAMIVGLLAGSRHALAIPPELASLVQSMLEAQV
jgi:hypothetical protein